MDEDIEALRKRVITFCEETGYRLSPQADEILGDIARMKVLAGDYFCPCQTQHIPDNVCVCQPVRQGLVDALGTCFCGLLLARE